VLSAAQIQTIATDSQAPTTPGSFAATTASSSQINLSWAASTDNVGVASYLIERCAGSSCTNFAPVGSPTGASYNDTGLSASTTYRYRIRSVDTAGLQSAVSAIANATTSGGGGGDVSPPTAPAGLTATAASSSQINLSWTASTDNVGVTGYRVERCQGAGCSSFSEIATPGTTSFGDTGLSASTSYSYRVRATDAVPNFSGYSNTASATTGAPGDVLAPSTPTGLFVIAASSNEIDLAWNASTDNVGVTGYVVERCQGAGCSSWSTVATPATTRFNDTSRSPSTSYSYRVSARDAATNTSPPSSPITFLTPASSPDCN
jgi:chitodextrinase